MSEKADMQLLSAGIEQLPIDVDEATQQRLMRFLELVMKWNKAYNLTAVRDIQSMIRLHLLDSLSIAPYVHGDRLLDVGTGAGFPGIPLAILMPEKQFVLLDGNGKKTRFVTQAKIELGLDNVEVRHARIENYQDALGFSSITCRAFSSLDNILQWMAHLLSPDTHLLAMKGQSDFELYNPSEQYTLETIRLQVPFVEAERHLVKITATEAI